MPVSGIGPVKSALLSLSVVQLAKELKTVMDGRSDAESLRPMVEAFCEREGVAV